MLEMCLSLLFKCYLWIDAHSIDTRAEDPPLRLMLILICPRPKPMSLSAQARQKKEPSHTTFLSSIHLCQREVPSLSFPRLFLSVESPPSTLKLSSTQGKLHGESRRLYNERGRENILFCLCAQVALEYIGLSPPEARNFNFNKSIYVYVF